VIPHRESQPFAAHLYRSSFAAQTKNISDGKLVSVNTGGFRAGLSYSKIVRGHCGGRGCKGFEAEGFVQQSTVMDLNRKR
jgi:hypothetical protein